MEANLDCSERPAQHLGSLGLASSLHVAEDDGEAIFLGKPMDLFVKVVEFHGFWPAFCVILLWN